LSPVIGYKYSVIVRQRETKKKKGGREEEKKKTEERLHTYYSGFFTISSRE